MEYWKINGIHLKIKLKEDSNIELWARREASN